MQRSCKQVEFCLREYATMTWACVLKLKTIPTHRDAQQKQLLSTLLTIAIDLKSSCYYDCTIVSFSIKTIYFCLNFLSVSCVSIDGMLLICLARKNTRPIIGNEEKRCEAKQFSIFPLGERADIVCSIQSSCGSFEARNSLLTHWSILEGSIARFASKAWNLFTS